ncbi:hypothetical protein ABZ387_37070, partial [Streptomyces flaveolus]|uniref:hypothetical protein n=1 Tax=Streptomyces flaveolus TaxID=67297 RepID=UPI0033E27591
MNPTDIDVDDFLEFIGDYNSKWTDDHKGIILTTPKRRPYQTAAYLVDRRRPKSCPVSVGGEVLLRREGICAMHGRHRCGSAG